MSTSETGHAKNAAEFGHLILAIQSLGAQYNPSAPEIKIPVLLTLKTTLDNAIVAVRVAESPYKNAVNARQLSFVGMSKLTTRVTDALGSCGATTKEIKDSLGISKKIKGGSSKKAETAAKAVTTEAETTVEDVVKHSVSQLSFDNRVENFKKLVTYVTGIPKFTPNEADLKVATLNIYVNGLPTLNNTVNTTHNTLNNNRISRNKLLYTPTTGAYDLSLQIKRYVKSVFGSTSPEYKNIAKIKLTNYTNK